MGNGGSGTSFPQTPAIGCSRRTGSRPPVTSVASWAGNKGPGHRPVRGRRQLGKAYSARQPCQKPKATVLFMERSLWCRTSPTLPFPPI